MSKQTCLETLPRSHPRPLGPGPQPFERQQQRHGEQDQHGGDGGDGRVEALAQAAEHFPRNSNLMRRTEHEHGHHLVEGGGEGEQRARGDARRDQRQHDPPEHDQWRRSEAGPGAGEIAVERGESSRDCHHHEGRAEHGVRGDQARIGLGQTERGEEQIEPHRDDDDGHDQRRQDQRHDQPAPAEIGERQADRGERAEHCGDDGRGDADQERVLHGEVPFRIGEDLGPVLDRKSVV